MPRVVEGGAVIGDGEFMNALDVTGILKSDGRKIRKRFQKLEVTRVEAVRPHAVDQLNHAEAGVAKPDRHRDNGLRFGFGLFVDLGEEPRVFRSVGNDDGFAVLRDPAGDPLADFDANIFQRL